MNETQTPTLDAIAAHGNRGHHHGCSEQSYDLVCDDGSLLSLLAGNGLLCNPYVLPCDDVPVDPNWIPPQSDVVAHDYPGPYSQVQVRCATPTLMQFLDLPEYFAEHPLIVDVPTLREFIHLHGGEFNPVAEAEDLLHHTNRQP